MNIRFGISIALVCIAVFSGCDRNRTEQPPDAAQPSTAVRPDTEMQNARVLLYNRGRVTTEILAQKILKYEARDSTLAYSLNVTSFDSLGQKTSSLISDSGIVRENTGLMMAYGHVIAYSQDSTKLETGQLNWNSKADRITTDAYVRITRANGDVITGYGLETDQKMNRLKILKQVKGTVQDVSRFNKEISDSGSSALPTDSASDSTDIFNR